MTRTRRGGLTVAVRLRGARGRSFSGVHQKPVGKGSPKQMEIWWFPQSRSNGSESNGLWIKKPRNLLEIPRGAGEDPRLRRLPPILSMRLGSSRLSLWVPPEENQRFAKVCSKDRRTAAQIFRMIFTHAVCYFSKTGKRWSDPAGRPTGGIFEGQNWRQKCHSNTEVAKSSTIHGGAQF